MSASTATGKSQVIAVGEPGPTIQQISTALSNQPEFELVDIFSNAERLVRDLQTTQADILVIDDQLGGQPTLDIIDDLVQQFPEMAIIAILPGNDPLGAQQVTLAGARAFLIQPFTQVNLLSTLRRVRDLQARQRQALSTLAAPAQDGPRPLRVVTVFSPRGGVGTSTVASSLAIALNDETSGRVLLMEGKLFFGHLDVMLNIRSRNSLAELIPHASSLDESMVNEVVTEHISGIDVLLAPSDMQFSQGIRAQDMFNVLNNLERFWDYVVIDAGSLLNENTVTMMDAADRIVLVASPELASLHDISRFTRISQSLAYPAEKILLVLNRAGIPGGIKARDIESVLHQHIFAQIPDDPANALRSLNRGIPLILNYPRSPASKAIKELGQKISQIGHEQPAGRPTQAAKPIGEPSGVSAD
jgi:pilus assembly protein CpaE